jgi:hypothetical protein
MSLEDLSHVYSQTQTKTPPPPSSIYNTHSKYDYLLQLFNPVRKPVKKEFIQILSISEERCCYYTLSSAQAIVWRLHKTT